MPVPSSGEIKLSDLVAEFGGDAPHAMSEYYRNGGRVPSNNTNIPTSGQFGLANAYGAVNEIAIAATSTTNLDISSLFGANWTSTVPKRLTIASGVTIGGTGSSAALIIPSGMAGTLEIDNAGSIIGYGGAAGSAGGTAISNASSGVTINNTGLLAGGGGGGGTGGTGGQGSVQSSYQYYNSYYKWLIFSSTHVRIVYNGSFYNYGTSSFGGGDAYDWQGPGVGGSYKGSPQQDSDPTAYPVLFYSTSYTSGGSGGSGGVGQGYSQTNTNGSSGSAGGTNAGTGGAGGNGGTYGTAGASGSTGANGNYTSGSAGSGGGAAGAAVAGTTVTMNNTGSLYGAVA